MTKKKLSMTLFGVFVVIAVGAMFFGRKESNTSTMTVTPNTVEKVEAKVEEVKEAVEEKAEEIIEEVKEVIPEVIIPEIEEVPAPILEEIPEVQEVEKTDSL